ncbi:MAG: glycosyltransferase family 39 protein [Candidatus Roizmanbacteria bacterium]|nr:glycosyltransferase family 39 protein [Candidatus Roizmanbacteria bacterium]
MSKSFSVEKLVILFTVVVSSVAAYISVKAGYILAYNDATAHLNTARRVVDNLTPGIVQLGSVWLPLLHILQIPFISIDYLWRSGLAGWIVSGISFVVTSLFLYKLVYYMTESKRAGFISVLVLVFNANMLYLQTTAMFEPLLMVTAVIAVYYLARWTKEEKINYLIFAAFFTMLATLTRYDGWALFVATSVYVLFVAIVKRIKHKEGVLFFFVFLAGFGIALWLLYNLTIFSDPLYFQRSEYSAGAQQDILEARGQLPTKKNWQLSFQTYSIAVIFNIGVIATTMGVLGILWYSVRNFLKPTQWAPLLLLVPYPFNILSLFLGQSVIWMPFMPPYFETFFNIRYGLLVLPAISFFVAYLTTRYVVAQILVVLLLGVQMYLFFVPSLLPLFGKEVGMVTLADTVSSVNEQTKNASDFLRNNYDGGLVMASSASIDAFIFRTGIPLKNYITEGTGHFWTESLSDPRRHATWIVFFQDTTDRVGKVVSKWKPLESEYDLVYEDQTYRIYRRKTKN